MQVQTLKEGVAHFQAMLDELASRQPLGLVLEGRQLEEEISLKLATFNHLQAQLNDELKVSQQLQHKLDQWDDSALLARVADLEMKWTRKQDSLRKSRPSLELTSIRHLKDELEAEIRELETLELEVPDK